MKEECEAGCTNECQRRGLDARSYLHESEKERERRKEGVKEGERERESKEKE